MSICPLACPLYRQVTVKLACASETKPCVVTQDHYPLVRPGKKESTPYMTCRRLVDVLIMLKVNTQTLKMRSDWIWALFVPKSWARPITLPDLKRACYVDNSQVQPLELLTVATHVSWSICSGTQTQYTGIHLLQMGKREIYSHLSKCRRSYTHKLM